MTTRGKTDTDSPSVQPRKRPSQARSRARVQRILDATRTLLKRGGITAVTTNHIAAEADMSVASVYQYFPNKQAILAALYQELLTSVMRTLEQYEDPSYRELPRREFFDRLLRALTAAEAADSLDLELGQALQMYPQLQELDNAHALLVAERLARLLQRFGSTWTLARLRRLTLFIYHLNSAVWWARSQLDYPRTELQNWQMMAVQPLLDTCFAEESGEDL